MYTYEDTDNKVKLLGKNDQESIGIIKSFSDTDHEHHFILSFQ